MSEKWGQLLDKLTSLTKEGKISWKESEEKDKISTDLKTAEVDVQFLNWDDSYIVIVKDELGLPVDQFTDEELTETGYVSATRTFETLFRTVRRQNSGADKALDNVLSTLSHIDDEIPF